MKKTSMNWVCLVCSMALLFVFSTGSARAESALDKVIEGAKKEGTLSMITPTGFTVKSFNRLRGEISKKYGVDLEFKYAVGWFPRDLAKALTEHKSGLSPSFDLFATSGTYILRGIQAGILERVDWESLVTQDTPSEVILGRAPQLEKLHGYGLTIYSAHSGGIINNPSKISAGQVPKTFKELADPKWRGEVGVNKGTSVWLNQSWAMGKDKGFSALRALVKNGSIIGGSRDLMTRYVTGEVSMAYMSGSFLPRIQAKGVPAEWQTLDLPLITLYSLAIRKGTPHPNAARLVALYLASPEGYKLVQDEGNAGNIYYAGNFEHNIILRDKKRGLPAPIIRETSDLLSFTLTKEAKSWEEEVKKILRGR